MKTATQIFEELLDAYDGYATDRIMATSTADAAEAQMDLHLADVRKYREEFREALEYFGNEERDEPEPASREEACGMVKFTVEAGRSPGPTLDVYVEPAAQPPSAQVIDLMEALKASLRRVPSVAVAMDERREGSGRLVGRPLDENRAVDLRHESVADRSERLAERHTRDDGSSR